MQEPYVLKRSPPDPSTMAAAAASGTCPHPADKDLLPIPVFSGRTKRVLLFDVSET